MEGWSTDFQRRSFEIRDQSRERDHRVAFVQRRSILDEDRFRALRDGDYVRIEGRFLDRQRFELALFCATTDNRIPAYDKKETRQVVSNLQVIRR